MDTAQFPGRLSESKGGTEYELVGRSRALLRLLTPAIKEQEKEGFVAADMIAEAGMDGVARRRCRELGECLTPQRLGRRLRPLV